MIKMLSNLLAATCNLLWRHQRMDSGALWSLSRNVPSQNVKTWSESHGRQAGGGHWDEKYKDRQPADNLEWVGMSTLASESLGRQNWRSRTTVSSVLLGRQLKSNSSLCRRRIVRVSVIASSLSTEWPALSTFWPGTFRPSSINPCSVA